MATKCIVLDTETTGLKFDDDNERHRIIEIGCVQLRTDGTLGARWQRYLNPERSVPRASYEVHGLDEEFLQDKPLFADVVDDFLTFIGEETLVMHNAPFDMSFLNGELSLLDKTPLAWTRVEDSLQKARERYPGERASLNALCRRFDISLENRKEHGALKDAELLARVYALMEGIGTTSLDLQFREEKRREDKASAAAASFASAGEKSLLLRLPSAEELSLHEAARAKMLSYKKGER